ncbi:proliferating cell nuclear antigen [Blastocladiella britannica]|nr:proliferating cell nuclear antigen [Blastocladiella britannica]
MLEARLPLAVTLKRVLDAIKDLVEHANFDCNDTGIALQAMDTSHVALVALMMRGEGFDPYRCDRNMSLGVHFSTLAKVLKCANNDDALTIKAGHDADVLNLTFEAHKTERISEFDIKLMDVDAEQLSIPETDYAAVVKMSSAEFARICNDMSVMGETVTIAVTKEAVKFSARGEQGAGSVAVRATRGGAAMDVDASAGSSSKAASAAIASETTITLEEAVELSFALKYLKMFAKAATLSPAVTLSMSADVPLMVEFAMDEDLGYIRFYLAPKLDDE